MKQYRILRGIRRTLNPERFKIDNKRGAAYRRMRVWVCWSRVKNILEGAEVLK